MNPIRLVQATCCLALSVVCLWAELGIPAALLALATCAYVALAREPGHG